jgi:hypothetical protein
MGRRSSSSISRESGAGEGKGGRGGYGEVVDGWLISWRDELRGRVKRIMRIECIRVYLFSLLFSAFLIERSRETYRFDRCRGVVAR